MIRKLYVRFIRPRIKNPLSRQRLKLLLFGWAYLPILWTTWIPERFSLLQAFLRADWFILHGHRPSEIMAILRNFRQLPSNGQVFVEAGCWQGGSSTKFSHICKRYSLKLYIFDSFQGVAAEKTSHNGYDFTGEYASPIEVLEKNLKNYGVPELCSIYPGWFSDTLAKQPPQNIAVAYIDCDIVDGTRDALTGIMPHLVPHGIVFSQDYHIDEVRALLISKSLWEDLHVPAPKIEYQANCTAKLSWEA